MWAVLPIAIGAVVIVCLHLAAVHAASSQMSRSRKIIRTTAAVVTLATIMMLAYAFGIASPAQPGPFVISWTASILLLGSLVVLCVLDVAGAARMAAQHTGELRQEMLELREQIAKEIAERAEQRARTAAAETPPLRLTGTDDEPPKA